MPVTDPNCTILNGIVAAKLASCYPAAKPNIENALAAISGLVCWSKESCYLAATTDIVLAGNVDTKIFWDIKIADSNNLYVIGSGDVILNRTGIYGISTTLAWQPATATDQLRLSLMINGQSKAVQTVQGRTDKIAYNNAAVTIQVNAADVVQIFAEYSHVADPDADLNLSIGSVFFLEMLQPL